MAEPRCLNALELATYCCLTTNGVRSWVKRGLLNAEPWDGLRYIERYDVT